MYVAALVQFRSRASGYVPDTGPFYLALTGMLILSQFNAKPFGLIT